MQWEFWQHPDLLPLQQFSAQDTFSHGFSENNGYKEFLNLKQTNK